MAAKKKQMAEDIRATWPEFTDSDISKKPQINGYGRKQKWIHENDKLLYGSAQYKAKHLGTVEVKTCNGKETVARAIQELKRKGTSKLPEVDIQISVRSLTITEVKSKMHICKFKLQKIAYCSDDGGSGHKIFSFIAKKGDATKIYFQCYCFETQNIAHKLTITVGQAFQLAYERFQEAKEASEVFVGKMKKIKAKRGKEDYVKKLAELHQHPAEDYDESGDTLSELVPSSQPRMGRRSSRDIREQDLAYLRETLRLVTDEELPFPQSNDIDAFDQAFESIQTEIEEWSRAKSPFQSDLEIRDALNELDSVIDPFGSDSTTQLNADSQTMLPQVSEQPEQTAL